MCRPFHAFNNGSYILLIPFYAGGGGAYFIYGDGPDLLQSGGVQPFFIGIDEAAIGKGGRVAVHEMEVKDGLEGSVLLYADITERLFFYGHDLADGSGYKAAGNPGLDDTIGSASANLAHKRPCSGDGADAGEEGLHFMAPGELGHSRLNFKACGGYQQDIHPANISNLRYGRKPKVCRNFAVPNGPLGSFGEIYRLWCI